MSVLIIIAGILNLVVVFFFLGKASYSFFPVLIWWFFWLFISSQSLTGIFVPHENTFLIFIFFLSSITCGGLLYKARLFRRMRLLEWQVVTDKPESSQYVYKVRNVLLALAYTTVLPIVAYFFIKSVMQILSYDSLLGYREYAFGIGGGSNIVFGNNRVMILYNTFVMPLAYFFVFTGIATFFKTKSRHMMLLGYSLIIMDATMMLGRFGFYKILVLEAFRHYYCFRWFGKLRIGFFGLGGAIALIIPLLFFVSFREDSDFSFQKVLQDALINYHTIGVSIFDDELNNKDSLLNQSLTLGIASLGVLERAPVLLLLKPMGFDVTSKTIEIGSYLQEFRTIGFDEYGRKINANAFHTALYPLYMDGRLFMVLLGGLVYGFFLAKYSRKDFETMNMLDFGVLFFLKYLGFFSIFQSEITGHFWLVLILLVLFHSRRARILVVID